jgi:superfamily I DNA/RNA helicase
MKRVVNMDGPPGTGKSTRLMRLFLAAVEEVGPKRVAAVTYTRSAAEVLRNRAGKTLKMGNSSRSLRKSLPYVGTVHSLCYHLLGRPELVSSKSLKEFCQYVGASPVSGVPDDADDLNDPWWTQSEDSGSGIGLMLRVLSAARNRSVDVDEVIPRLVPPTQLSIYRPEWFKTMIHKYEEWKHDRRLMDYDDLLEAGRKTALPVDTLLCDEVQDNSKLMWEVMDAWAAHSTIRIALFAGDPFQAIYRFSGADPSLFLDHPGEWVYLKKSHRLDDYSAGYAYNLLRHAGWDLTGKPELRGEGVPKGDGSALYLARTHTLVGRLRRELEDAGTPYLGIRSFSLFNSKAANAFRTVRRLEEGGMVDSRQLKTLIDSASPGSLSRDERARLERMSEGGHPTTARDVEKILPLSRYMIKDPDVAAYMRRVEAVHGYKALFETPVVLLGTIHSCKGMEADDVTVLQDWGSIPSRSAATPGDEAKGEACVAYVAVTRHRRRLDIRYLGETPAYNFPIRLNV